MDLISAFVAAALAGLWLALSHALLPRFFVKPWHQTICYVYGTVTVGLALTGKWLVIGSLHIWDYWIVLGGAGFGTVVLGYMMDRLAGHVFDWRESRRERQ